MDHKGPLGFIEYLVQSNDAADYIKDEDRFKCIDDLSILELLLLSGLLTEFDYHQTVPLDIGTDSTLRVRIWTE